MLCTNFTESLNGLQDLILERNQAIVTGFTPVNSKEIQTKKKI